MDRMPHTSYIVVDYTTGMIESEEARLRNGGKEGGNTVNRIGTKDMYGLLKVSEDWVEQGDGIAIT